MGQVGFYEHGLVSISHHKDLIPLIKMDNYKNLNHYEMQALGKLKGWQTEMQRKQRFFSRMSKKIQDRVNRLIPDKVHATITAIMRKMVETVLFTSELVKPAIVDDQSLEQREDAINKRMEFYRTTAAAEGGITGAGGFLAALADFPALLIIKIKFLFDVAAIYGHDTSQMRERIFLLHVFQLAFSSPTHQKETYNQIAAWSANPETIPYDPEKLNWYRFQQDYRDYLDIAKLLQMMPVIGAAVGIVVNYKLINKLDDTAMMCYRMRWLQEKMNPKKIIE
jgi:hypothetical protein